MHKPEKMASQDPAKKEKWVKAVEEIIASAEKWALEAGWMVARQEKIIQGDYCGEYPLPMLFVRTPQTQLSVDPVGMDIISADGLIDIEAFPTGKRFILIRKGKKLRFVNDNFKEIEGGWNKENFIFACHELGKLP
jgi:hypothetical protein